MITSVCVLGNTKTALEFIKEYKALKYYKKRDSDTEGVRIHVLYVDDIDLLSTDLTLRYELDGGNYANVLNDGTKGTNKESTISNDTEWLQGSNGHDTIVEAVEDADKYYLTLLELVKKGFSIHLTTPTYINSKLEEILAVAKESGAVVTTHSDIYSALELLDSEYKDKLSRQRDRLLADSYDVEPCGLG